jgi:hypothetical protein
MRLRRPLIALSAAAAAAIVSALPRSTVQAPRIGFNPERYVCLRAETPPRIDGVLDDPAWSRAAWTEPFVDIEGDLKPRPRFATRVRMLWDDDSFYVGAELKEPQVWATLTERDSIIFRDNDFEVFIDPDGDTHNYYELELNALNTVWDLFLVKPYRDGGPALHAWDIRGLKSAVAVQGTLNDPSDRDRGWTVEIAFPHEVLKETLPDRRRPAAGDVWRINFSRVEYRVEAAGGAYRKVADPMTGEPLPEDNWVWSPQGLVNIHLPEMWGYVLLSGASEGGEAAEFLSAVDERAKWALRRVYYREWAYHDEYGAFSGDLAALGLRDDPELRKEFAAASLAIRVTPSLFEAWLTTSPETTWRIRQDGLVWMQK